MSDVSKTNELIAEARKWIKLHRENEYQREAAKIMTSVVAALEAATRVPVQGERELAADAWAIRNEFLAFWGRHSANDLAVVGYSPKMPETPILDTWHPRDGSGEAVQGEPQVYLFHEDGTPKSNDEIRHEAAVLRGDVPVQGEPQWVKDNRVARDLVKPAKVNPATVEGEPNDELIEYALDYIENGTMRPERREALRALASRASVLDAATGRVAELEAELESRIEDRDYWYGIADKAKDQRDAANDSRRQTEYEIRELLRVDIPSLKAERDAALAAIERVRAIHAPLSSLTWGAPEEFQVCEECNDPDARDFIYWPCSTIQALDGAPEPEAEEEMYQAGCGSWDCRAPECGKA